ncbi:MAG: hypothetical protein K9M51_01945 [Candidatus Gracilibacteria bacterium]|nr:hypothetical protein [Candidatus Gracilibacteria bacterium]
MNAQVDASAEWAKEMKNAKIWSREAQNDLAGKLKTKMELEKAKKESLVRQVQRGDTVGAIAKGFRDSELLQSSSLYSTQVRYEKGLVTGAQIERWNETHPKYPISDAAAESMVNGTGSFDLSQANFLLPGWYAHVEDNVLVLSAEKQETVVEKEEENIEEDKEDDREDDPARQDNSLDEEEDEGEDDKEDKEDDREDDPARQDNSLDDNEEDKGEDLDNKDEDDKEDDREGDPARQDNSLDEDKEDSGEDVDKGEENEGITEALRKEWNRLAEAFRLAQENIPELKEDHSNLGDFEEKIHLAQRAKRALNEFNTEHAGENSIAEGVAQDKLEKAEEELEEAKAKISSKQKWSWRWNAIRRSLFPWT